MDFFKSKFSISTTDFKKMLTLKDGSVYTCKQYHSDEDITLVIVEKFKHIVNADISQGFINITCNFVVTIKNAPELGYYICEFEIDPTESAKQNRPVGTVYWPDFAPTSFMQKVNTAKWSMTYYDS